MNMDVIKAPYLEAIQGVFGQTPAAKHKRVQYIARVISRVSRPTLDSSIVLPPVLKPLEPLFRVEIAKILHQYDVIIDALKSDNLNVIFRALQAKWLFDGTENTWVNASYFTTEVFPHISLYARRRVIKNFGRWLKNPFVAEQFFILISDQYGTREAIPLLVVCNEQFAFDMMVRRKINLSLKMVRALYQKFPKLVVKYLMLSAPANCDTRDAYRISIQEYLNFLPRFAIKHIDEFMVLYHMHGGFKVKLGKKAGDIFIKKCLTLLMQNPIDYLHLISLKLVTKRLSHDQFTIMFENWFPKEQDLFKFSRAHELLRYYKPETDKLTLILNMFRKVYGQDLLKCIDLVTPQLMELLPAAERVEIARLKLQNNQDWSFERPEFSWRCYLPTSESIPLIKTEFERSFHGSTRSGLTTLAVFTCKINNDKNAISDVLNYAYENHRNDFGIFNFLHHVQDFFDLSTLDASHWVIIDKYMKLVEGQDRTISNSVMLAIIEKAFHYRFLNDLPTDDYLRLFIKLKLTSGSKDWNILTKYPEWERKCLGLFINAVSMQYPLNVTFWTTKKLIRVILGLALSLYKFYERNKQSDSELRDVSIKKYPWLFEKIQQFVFGNWEIVRSEGSELLAALKRNENDFYRQWLNSVDQFWNLGIDIMLDILREHPQRIMEYWKECFDKIQDMIQYSSKEGNKFIRKCRWYEDLPIRFFEASLENFRTEQNMIAAVKIFALMLDGQTFVEIVGPIVPRDERIDIDDEGAPDYYRLLLVTASQLRKVNPPVCLDIIANFCIAGYLQMAMRSICHVCRRVPANKAILFAKSLADRRVSVMKLGIRVFYMVGTLAEFYDFLVYIWNMHRHMSIRSVVFKKIYDLFVEQPEAKSWHMMRTCILTLNISEHVKIFNILVSLDFVPNEYLREYIQFLLVVLDKLRKNCNQYESSQYLQLACKLINNIDYYIIEILPEAYTQELIKAYLFNLYYNEMIFKVGRDLMCRYLFGLHGYNVLRFDFFAFHFQEIVNMYWGKKDDTDNFYPVNFMIRNLFDSLIFDCDTYNRAGCFERLLEIFLSVFMPHQEMCTYVNLVFNIEFHKFPSMRGFAMRISQKIPHLIVIFSPQLTMLLGGYLRSFLLKKAAPGKYEKKFCLTVAETLIESGNIHCSIIATLLFHVSNENTLKMQEGNVLSKLRNSQHPAIVSNLYAYLNVCDFVP